MKKQMKTLIYGSAVLVVLAVAALLATKLINKPDPTPDNGGIKEQLYALYDENRPIASVTTTDMNGYSFVITRSVLLDGTEKFALSDDGTLQDYHYSEFSMSRINAIIAKLPVREILEDGGDLEPFGLSDNWQSKTVVKYVDGGTATVYIGTTEPTSSSRYMRVEGDDRIYIIARSTADMFTTGPDYYRNLAVMPELGENDEDLSEVRLTPPGASRIILRRMSEEEFLASDNKAYSMFRMSEPYVGFTNEVNLSDMVLSPVTMIYAAGVIKNHLIPDEYVQYGLDNPYIVTFVVKDIEYTIYLGDGDDSIRFMRVEGEDSVYQASGDFSFMKLSAMDLFGRLVWLHNIKDVHSMTYYKKGGGTDAVEVEDKTGETSDDGYFIGRLNGADIGEENARRLFLHTISITYATPLPDGNEVDITDPDYKMTIAYNDGGPVYEVWLKQYNSRQYAIVLVDEGQPSPAQFLVNVTDLDTIWEAIAGIKNGEDITKR